LHDAQEDAVVEKKIRIALMLTAVGFGGLERVCMTLLKNINRERFDVVPILLTRPWERDNMFVRELGKEGYDCCEIPEALRESGDYLRVARCYTLVWKQLKDGSFDVLHTNGYFADIVGIPVARMMGLPTVSTVHGFLSHTWNLRLYNVIDRLLLRLATRVLAVSDALKRHLVESGLNPSRVRVIVNAVDLPKSNGSVNTDPDIRRGNHNVNRDEFCVGYVGRLSVEKGLTHLVAACVRLIRDGVPLRVLIVGDGPQRKELEQLSLVLGLGDRVVFAGFQEDIAAWMLCMDVFVLPSLTEGTPISLLEAMAYGVPVVATAVGGVPQVIEHGENGILVLPGRAEEISNAILALFKDSTARQKLAQNALVQVRTRYSAKQWIDRIEMEYQSLSRRLA
jgi:glycosyltransferase involved in cell wall biosynthesis